MRAGTIRKPAPTPSKPLRPPTVSAATPTATSDGGVVSTGPPLSRRAVRTMLAAVPSITSASRSNTTGPGSSGFTRAPTSAPRAPSPPNTSPMRICTRPAPWCPAAAAAAVTPTISSAVPVAVGTSRPNTYTSSGTARSEPPAPSSPNGSPIAPPQAIASNISANSIGSTSSPRSLWTAPLALVGRAVALDILGDEPRQLGLALAVVSHRFRQAETLRRREAALDGQMHQHHRPSAPAMRAVDQHGLLDGREPLPDPPDQRVIDLLQAHRAVLVVEPELGGQPRLVGRSETVRRGQRLLGRAQVEHRPVALGGCCREVGCGGRIGHRDLRRYGPLEVHGFSSSLPEALGAPRGAPATLGQAGGSPIP